MYTFILFALVNLAAAGPLIYRATINAPVIKGSTEACNITTTYPWKLRRDGGGGGTIDGKHVLNFADTSTLNEPFHEAHGYYPFISNSIATASDVSSHEEQEKKKDWSTNKQWETDRCILT